ncbi:MAG: DUF1501 domain-containing protein [Planctomyces sp.]|nr:DUF1501 domain-containing protein [Planctomyces sp.]
MLRIGRQRVRTCGGMSRRELLRVGGLSVAGLTLSDLLRIQAQASESTPAKSVILLWLWGGPSHLETYDPKPAAPLEYRGPYAPIATSVPGLPFCELLPQLATRADRLAVLRSLHHSSNDHGIAGTISLTGSAEGAVSLGGQTLPGRLQPTHGSIVSRILGDDASRAAFVALGGKLHQGKKAIAGETAGILGTQYDAFRLDYDPETGVKAPSLDLLDGLSASGIDDRRRLRDRLESMAERLHASGAMERLDRNYRQAFSLLTTPEARNVYELSRESEALRRRYGRFRFGECCLLARRMVEAGVRFVQVNWSSHVESEEDTGDGGWDMHDRYFQIFQTRHAWMFDQAASALLDDLAERGLLEETIVVAIGEFGRTPKINDKAGRDHWNQCYSGWLAGGGIRPGAVVGTSDRFAELPASRPVTPADLFATVHRQLGIGAAELTELGLTPQGEAIEELL